MWIDARARLLDEAWGGTVFTLSGEDRAEAFPGGFEEAAGWCAANGEADWTVERTPLPK